MAFSSSQWAGSFRPGRFDPLLNYTSGLSGAACIGLFTDIEGCIALLLVFMFRGCALARCAGTDMLLLCSYMQALDVSYTICTVAYIPMWCGGVCSRCVGLCWCSVQHTLLLNAQQSCVILTPLLPSLQDRIMFWFFAYTHRVHSWLYKRHTHCFRSAMCADRSSAGDPAVWRCDSAHTHTHTPQHFELLHRCMAASGWHCCALAVILAGTSS